MCGLAGAGWMLIAARAVEGLGGAAASAVSLSVMMGLLAGMNAVRPSEAGLASGVLNTAMMIGGALGLAILAGLAAARTQAVQVPGTGQGPALLSGYRLAFGAGAAFAVVAALTGLRRLRAAAAPRSELALDDA